jgi:UDP-N-acetylmuramyl tripeptide synthase
MPVFLTIIIAKLILQLSRRLGRGGGAALPGLVAERLDHEIGAKLARRLAQGSILVTGTNGKTTTTKMLGQILTDSGQRLVVNRAGSNLSRGVVSALIEHSNFRGQFKETMGLFEVDEAAMPAVASMVQPRSIVVLNLFRDQLDRYGELDTTATLIGKGIATTQAQLYLNADDPLVADLARYAKDATKVSYFGVHDVPASKLVHDVTADSDTCPVCGRALEYSRNFYGHIGHYRCPEGHVKRVKPQLEASDLNVSEAGCECKLNTGRGHDVVEASIQLPGIYNVYNALGAVITAQSVGVELSATVASLARVGAAFGRVELISLDDNKQLYLLLVKNPTGFNQIIQTFMLQEKQQQILLAINDNFADGRDVSWLWDVAFEELTAQDHLISVTGLRATDMALRLKYADIASFDVNSNLHKSLNQFIEQLVPGQIGYVVPTYTAMTELRRQLGRKTKLPGVWE